MEMEPNDRKRACMVSDIRKRITIVTSMYTTLPLSLLLATYK